MGCVASFFSVRELFVPEGLTRQTSLGLRLGPPWRLVWAGGGSHSLGDTLIHDKLLQNDMSNICK